MSDAHDETAAKAKVLEAMAKEFAKHDSPGRQWNDIAPFARDLHVAALRYARAYYAEAREYGLIPEYERVSPTAAPPPSPVVPHEPPTSPIVVNPDDIRIGDVFVGWRSHGSPDWSTIGIIGDMRVVSRDKYQAKVASGDTMRLSGNYQFQVRRSSP